VNALLCQSLLEYKIKKEQYFCDVLWFLLNKLFRGEEKPRVENLGLI